MKYTSSDSTLEVNEAFERDCMTQMSYKNTNMLIMDNLHKIFSNKIVKEKCNILFSVALVLINKMVFPNEL